ncbi:uracil-DNA glycosylase family protein [Aquiflexum lacus]|uniref:uracil-DNA glycosylase family protein n=1 Tax=Aquiflexum lacus TaxID=2483805 RepID=UPI00189590EC|nr:uracil-DNA glycosylase family protein [Aquiflexum lacus]
MKTFADKIISYNSSLEFKGKLPVGIRIMNPFQEDKNVIPISSTFYKKYYNDNHKRHLILGINPGRFGAGLTGIPFTDPKRLIANCGIEFNGHLAHEPSSVFVYEVINAFGGEEAFYKRFYINSICPLGFTSLGKNGKEVNYNYYDSKELTQSVFDFIIENIRKQIEMGIYTDICYCFGTGKNEKFLLELNNQFGFFKKIIALEHPRYVMQYKSKSKEAYISKYLSAFNEVRKPYFP